MNTPTKNAPAEAKALQKHFKECQNLWFEVDMLRNAARVMFYGDMAKQIETPAAPGYNEENLYSSAISMLSLAAAMARAAAAHFVAAHRLRHVDEGKTANKLFTYACHAAYCEGFLNKIYQDFRAPKRATLAKALEYAGGSRYWRIAGAEGDLFGYEQTENWRLYGVDIAAAA